MGMTEKERRELFEELAKLKFDEIINDFVNEALVLEDGTEKSIEYTLGNTEVIYNNITGFDIISLDTYLNKRLFKLMINNHGIENIQKVFKDAVYSYYRFYKEDGKSLVLKDDESRFELDFNTMKNIGSLFNYLFVIANLFDEFSDEELKAIVRDAKK